MPLNILLGADSLAQRRSGIGRVTYEIGSVLRGRPETANLRLLVNGRVHPASFLDTVPEYADTLEGGRPAAVTRRLSLSARVGSLPGFGTLRSLVVRERVRAAAREMGPGALYHEPNMIARPFPGITVTTFNDLSWRTNPEWHPQERVAWIERNLQRTIDQTQVFVAISAFTADEMVRHLGIDRARIDVVPLAPSRRFQPLGAETAAPVLARFGLADRRYVLSVSTLEPRKNFDRLLRAHAALPERLAQGFPLAIAGGHGWGRTLADPLADRLVSSGRLRLLGHVPDADLAALTARCAVFAYVSLYEGFGLPVVEAMAAGAPVVASGTTATIETAGGAALPVDPLDVPAVTHALRRVIEDQDLAQDLRQRGLARAAGFSWEHTVDVMTSTWERAVRQAPASSSGRHGMAAGAAVAVTERQNSG